jgi:putative oxidoreductase
MEKMNNKPIDIHRAHYAAFVLRVSLGVVFIAHALLKPLVFTLPGTAQFFAAHGFPGWSAYPVFVAELIGGLALVAGFHARIASVTLIPVMAGAFFVHWPNGWMFTAPNGGWEYVSFLLAALIAQALLGDGAFALRHALWSGGTGGAINGRQPGDSRLSAGGAK